MLLTPVTQIEHQYMIGPKYYFGLRVQSVCRHFSFRMKFKIGGSRVQYVQHVVQHVQHVQEKIPFRMSITRPHYDLFSFPAITGTESPTNHT
jgi:hypothetical protein